MPTGVSRRREALAPELVEGPGAEISLVQQHGGPAAAPEASKPSGLAERRITTVCRAISTLRRVVSSPSIPGM
jgi:hypothetical protein